MSLTESRTLIRRSAEQWQEILQRFEHCSQTQAAFCAAEELALSTFTLWRCKLGSSREVITNNDAASFHQAFHLDLVETNSLQC